MDHDEEIPALVRAGSVSVTTIAGGDGGAAAALPSEGDALDPGIGGTASANAAPQRGPERGEERAVEEEEEAAIPERGKPEKGKGKKVPNNVRRLRIERMMSKAELARRANLSVLTIDRVEKGYGCRMDSKRKILEALGLSLADRVRVFGEEE